MTEQIYSISLRANNNGVHDPTTYASVPAWESEFETIGGVYLYPGDDDYSTPKDGTRLAVRAWTPDLEASLGSLWAKPTLSSDISSGDSTIPVTYSGDLPAFLNSAVVDLKFDDGTGEIVRVGVPTGTSPNWNIPVTVRGWEETNASAHTTGAKILPIADKLFSQVWLPVGGTEGHTYFVTWDAWFPPDLAFSVQGHSFAGKMWNFCDGDSVNIQGRVDTNEITGGTLGKAGWLELHHGTTGPNTDTDPSHSQIRVGGVLPTRFNLDHSKWVRHFFFIDMKVADPSWYTLYWWMADEDQDAQSIIAAAKIDDAFDNTFGIVRFEFDSSRVRLDEGEAVIKDPRYTYVRNYVVLEDLTLSEAQALLIKPVA